MNALTESECDLRQQLDMFWVVGTKHPNMSLRMKLNAVSKPHDEVLIDDERPLRGTQSAAKQPDS